MTSKRFWKGFAKGKYAVAIKDKNRYHAEEPFQDSEQEGIQGEDVAVDDVNAEEEPVQEET